MAKQEDESTAKLKLVHLLWMLLVGCIMAGIAIGSLMNQQGTNTEAIKQKVEKDIFQMHSENQERQFDVIQKTMGKIDEKLDKMAQ